MSRANVLRVLASLLLLTVGVYVARHTYWDDETIPQPLAGEARSNVYYSLERAMHALGVRTRVVAALTPGPPAGGILLANNVRSDFRHKRVDSLTGWVEAGGRLIVAGESLAADTALQEWSGIKLVMGRVEKSADGAAAPPPQPFIKTEEPCQQAVVRVGRETRESLSLCGYSGHSAFHSAALPDWSLATESGMQSLRLRRGSGALIVLPRGNILDNRSLLQGDNAAIFLAAADLPRGAELLLFKPAEAEQWWAMLWRLAAPGIVFVGLAGCLLILRHWPRFGPPVPAPSRLRRSLGEQIRANAAFAWRTRKLNSLRLAVLKALEEASRHHIRAYATTDVRRRATLLAGLTGVDERGLRSAMTDDAVAAPQVQRAAIRLLEQTRRILKRHTATGKRMV